MLSAKPKAEANNTYRDLDYLGYHKKTESNNCSIIMHRFEESNDNHTFANNLNCYCQSCIARAIYRSKKDNHPRPLPQQGFCTSLQIWDELGVTWQTVKQRVVVVVVFLPSQGPWNLHFLNTFSWPFVFFLAKQIPYRYLVLLNSITLKSNVFVSGIQ